MSAERVALVCSSTGWAGTEKWSLRAAEELAKNGRKVTFVARRPDVFRPRLRTELDFAELPFRNEADLATVLRLAALLRKRADVAVLTRVKDYWLGGLAARLAGVPVLLRLGVVRRLRDLYLMDRLRYGTLPSALLVNAEAIRDTLLKTPWIRPDNVHVIYNGVDTPGKMPAPERAKIRAEAGVDPEDVLIVGAGRLAVEKRWDWLIRAAGRLAAVGERVAVRILGEGSERPALEKTTRDLGLEGRVVLPGARPDAARWLGAADVVALPSDNEGISNTMLEAVGQGVPVVATASGGVREHFTDGRDLLLAETDDFEGFAERLTRIVHEPALRTEVGGAGLATARASFRWEEMTRRLASLLDSLATGGAA